ncbi:hypothetical protein NDU88_010997 [Pleurodeles waltl]|uniref:Uncharacterized protein n=1 Tax=Pleurodeles waltl TaxID=8319 RepID=A0AAV7S3H0_PLEWA|nr:hypothetical protein NDU88_010997 [Pleurodeles waltl]
MGSPSAEGEQGRRAAGAGASEECGVGGGLQSSPRRGAAGSGEAGRYRTAATVGAAPSIPGARILSRPGSILPRHGSNSAPQDRHRAAGQGRPHRQGGLPRLDSSLSVGALIPRCGSDAKLTPWCHPCGMTVRYQLLYVNNGMEPTGTPGPG